MNPDSSEDKKMYTIGQISRLLDVKEHTIRFWEKEFPMIIPVRTSSGRREYSKKDFDLLQKIKKLLYEEGYTAKGALKELQMKMDLREEAPDIQIQKDSFNLFYESPLDPQVAEAQQRIDQKSSDVRSNNQKASSGLKPLKSHTFEIENRVNIALWNQLYQNLSKVIGVLENE